MTEIPPISKLFSNSTVQGFLLRYITLSYLKRKPYNVLFESNIETWRISVMEGSRRFLVKVVLFQLRGRSQPQNDATANFFLQILNALYQGFQMRYHLFQKFFGKMVKIKETSFLSTRGMYLSCHGCISLVHSDSTTSGSYSVSLESYQQ